MSGLPELHGYHVHIYYNDATMPIAARLQLSTIPDWIIPASSTRPSVAT